MKAALTKEIAETLVKDAHMFWRQDRAGWPLDRALRAFITYETSYEWGSYDRETNTFTDGEAYDHLFDLVLNHERSEVE